MRAAATQPTGVGWTLIRLPVHADSRGVLVPFEFADLSFVPQRVFVVSGVPPKTTRGGHAHRSARQLLYCPAGSIVVDVRTGDSTETVLLDDNARALLVEPGVWSSQTFETAESVLVVLSSEPYHRGSYLPDADA
jgi:dTDP-4-dehydrorhamnose 3,5-epimerase-like enzyme